MEISSIATMSRTVATQPPVPAEPAPTRPGKSGSAVGHIAKQSVADARAAGIEVPKNAQGLAASQIAKGADPASIFAAQTSEEGDVDGDPVVGDVPDVTDAPDGTDAPVDVVGTDGAVVAPVADDPVQDDAVDAVAEDLADTAAVQYAENSRLLSTSGDTSAQIALDLLS